MMLFVFVKMMFYSHLIMTSWVLVALYSVHQWLQRAENVYQGVVLLSIEWHDGPVADTGS